MITEYYEDRTLFIRAVRAARLSWDSMAKSDSYHCDLGEKDKALVNRLIRSGESHTAAFRQTFIAFHLRASRAFWQEFSKHRIGVEMYSESTMHTFHKRELTRDDFYWSAITDDALVALNRAREAKDRDSFKLMLPESFLQTRAISMNYVSLRHMYHRRHDHRWPEWPEFCEEILSIVAFPFYITEGLK
jgi:thymidylate synthase ThyX